MLLFITIVKSELCNKNVHSTRGRCSDYGLSLFGFMFGFLEVWCSGKWLWKTVEKFMVVEKIVLKKLEKGLAFLK